MTQVRTGPSDSPSRWRQPVMFIVSPRAVVLATLVGWLAMALAGMIGPVSLGDECDHFRRGREYTRSWARQSLDPMTVLPDRQCPISFDGTPLWHMGLGLVWRICGRPAQWAAQLYHASYYALLGLCVYFGARRLWDPSAASWAWLIALTTPMICAYSIVLYQDVPGIAVSMLGLFLLWRRNFLASGIVLAAAYMTKMNMLSYAPWACLFALWWAKGTWIDRLIAAAKVALPVLAVFSYDTWWRYQVYEHGIRGPNVLSTTRGLTTTGSLALGIRPNGYVEWKPFLYYRPWSIVSHLGLLTLGGALPALVRCRDVRSRWIWLALAICVAGFYAVFVRLESPQIRYLMPAVAMLALLAGGALRGLRLPRWMLTLVVAGGLVQAGVAAGYVASYKRQIPAGEREAFEWVRHNTTPRQRILHPEAIIMSAAARAQIWGQLNISYFTSEADDQTRHELLDYFKVAAIVVPKRRVYDSAREGPSIQGYPADFVEHIRHVDYLELVLENDDAIVFRVRPRSPVASQPVAPQAAPAPAP